MLKTLRPQSNQNPYDAYYSGDPAFAQLPDDADDAARAEHDRRWDVARATGDYSAVLAEGRTLADATKYVMRPIAGHQMRKLFDMRSDKRIGNSELAQLAFRMALADVAGFPGLVVKHERHEDPAYASLGKMLSLEATNLIDAESIAIIGELGALAYARALGLRPL